MGVVSDLLIADVAPKTPPLVALLSNPDEGSNWLNQNLMKCLADASPEAYTISGHIVTIPPTGEN